MQLFTIVHRHNPITAISLVAPRTLTWVAVTVAKMADRREVGTHQDGTVQERGTKNH